MSRLLFEIKTNIAIDRKLLLLEFDIFPREFPDFI